MIFNIGVEFSTATEAAEKFNVPGPQRGQGIVLFGNSRQELWFPIINGDNNWSNGYDRRRHTITEMNLINPKEHVATTINDPRDRVTFAKINGRYRFVGVYAIDKPKSTETTISYKMVSPTFNF